MFPHAKVLMGLKDKKKNIEKNCFFKFKKFLRASLVNLN